MKCPVCGIEMRRVDRLTEVCRNKKCVKYGGNGNEQYKNGK